MTTRTASVHFWRPRGSLGYPTDPQMVPKIDGKVMKILRPCMEKFAIVTPSKNLSGSVFEKYRGKLRRRTPIHDCRRRVFPELHGRLALTRRSSHVELFRCGSDAIGELPTKGASRQAIPRGSSPRRTFRCGSDAIGRLPYTGTSRRALPQQPPLEVSGWATSALDVQERRIVDNF